jgi:hypothetical protein
LFTLLLQGVDVPFNAVVLPGYQNGTLAVRDVFAARNVGKFTGKFRAPALKPRQSILYVLRTV